MFQPVPVFLSLLLCLPCGSESVTNAETMQRVSRYQLALFGAQHEQRDLLAVPVEIEFGDDVQTVGEAIALLVEGSGYRLAEVDPEGQCRQGILALPLPQVHRKLDGLTLRQALEVLTGPAFRPVTAEPRRLLSIEQVQAESAKAAERCSCE